MRLAVLVSLAAGLGALLRHLVTVAVARRRAGTFPVATLGVNTTGSFLAGLALGAGTRGVLGDDAVVVATAGLLGGFTTLSTWAWDTVALAEERAWSSALWNVAATLTCCVLAAGAGFAVGA